jgi:signal transduction histidine kinase
LRKIETCTARLAPRGAVPLIVVRLPELEKTAWRRGLRAARALERVATGAFASAAARTLRSDDVIAHERGSDNFIALLTARTREGDAHAQPIDARSALARIAASVEQATSLTVESGWTILAEGENISDAQTIRRALARGAQERERYAFFSALGHELRTPLASIRGYLETLLDDDVPDETRRRFVAIAHGESLRLARLIDGMFEISLLDLHAGDTSRARGMPGAALEAALAACAASATSRETKIAVLTPELPAVVIDDDRLTLVLINVLDNAIKHGRLGGRIEISAMQDATTVVLMVDDDGPGMCADDRERLFELGARGATDAPGSGIGLAFVRLLLERAGGRIDIDDAPHGGTRVRVHVPRVHG